MKKEIIEYQVLTITHIDLSLLLQSILGHVLW